MAKMLAALSMSCLLVACDQVTTYAPVADIGSIEPLPANGRHVVKSKETIYEIAWRYGLDYRQLASRNKISAPYVMHAGQVISLRKSKKVTIKPQEAAVNSSNTLSKNISYHEAELGSKEPHATVSTWIWPATGKLVDTFSAMNKGINISGYLGQAVLATAAGKVVYAGNGLRGYGNLIIIKHNSLYLSAYAHNKTILVKEGDWVTQGQKIAEMGHTGPYKAMLHFEIRQAGKPVDPIAFLRN